MVEFTEDRIRFETYTWDNKIRLNARKGEVSRTRVLPLPLPDYELNRIKSLMIQEVRGELR